MGWNEISTVERESSFIKLKAGDKFTFHVLGDEPHTFYQYFDQAASKSVNVPAGWKSPKPEYKVAQRHAFTVYVYETKKVGIWVANNKTANDIKSIYDGYGGSLDALDLKVSRAGDGLKTTYTVVPIPTKFKPEYAAGQEIPDVPSIIKISDETAGSVETSDTEFNTTELEQVEEVTGEPESDELPLELSTPPVVAKAIPANGDSGEKGQVVKSIMHTFATVAKFKDSKMKLAVLKQATKSTENPEGKTVLAKFTLDELKKLAKLIGAK